MINENGILLFDEGKNNHIILMTEAAQKVLRFILAVTAIVCIGCAFGADTGWNLSLTYIAEAFLWFSAAALFALELFKESYILKASEALMEDDTAFSKYRAEYCGLIRHVRQRAKLWRIIIIAAAVLFAAIYITRFFVADLQGNKLIVAGVLLCSFLTPYKATYGELHILFKENEDTIKIICEKKNLNINRIKHYSFSKDKKIQQQNKYLFPDTQLRDKTNNILKILAVSMIALVVVSMAFGFVFTSLVDSGRLPENYQGLVFGLFIVFAVLLTLPAPVMQSLNYKQQYNLLLAAEKTPANEKIISLHEAIRAYRKKWNRVFLIALCVFLLLIIAAALLSAYTKTPQSILVMIILFAFAQIFYVFKISFRHIGYYRQHNILIEKELDILFEQQRIQFFTSGNNRENTEDTVK